MKSISQMDITEILIALKDYLNNSLFNVGLKPDDKNYVIVKIDEPPQQTDYRRAAVVENSDMDCFGFEGRNEYVTIILSLWYNPELINADRNLEVEKPFTYKDAQGESRAVLRILRQQTPHPFVAQLVPLTVNRIETEENFVVYSLPFKAYVSIVH